MEIKTVTFFILLSASITLFLSGWSVKYIKTYGSKAFTALMISLTLFLVGYGFQLSGKTLNEAIYWSNLKNTGAALFPPLCGEKQPFKAFILPGTFFYTIRNSSAEHHLIISMHLYVKPGSNFYRLCFNSYFPVGSLVLCSFSFY